MRTMHAIFDINNDGVISYDDFMILSEKFSDLGHLKPQELEEFKNVLKVSSAWRRRRKFHQVLLSFSQLGSRISAKWHRTTLWQLRNIWLRCTTWWLTKASRKRSTNSFHSCSKPSTKITLARYPSTSSGSSSSAWAWRRRTLRHRSRPSTRTATECCRLKSSWNLAATSSWPRTQSECRGASGDRSLRHTEGFTFAL